MALAKNSRAGCGHVGKLLLLALPLFGISFTGCNNTCFSVTSNPPTGTVNIKAGDPTPTCALTTANGAVRVMTHTVSTCTFCSTSSRIAHIFVSLRGIEIHPSAIADDAAPDWQELMPALEGHPLQFDLVGSAPSRDAQLSLGEGAAIPGAYRQLRLRLVPNQPRSEDPVPEKNACGATGLNCVVSEDGRTYPLLFDRAAPEFRLTSERIAGGVVLIPPDSNSGLVIDFHVVWARSLRLLARACVFSRCLSAAPQSNDGRPKRSEREPLIHENRKGISVSFLHD